MPSTSQFPQFWRSELPFKVIVIKAVDSTGIKADTVPLNRKKSAQN